MNGDAWTTGGSVEIFHSHTKSAIYQVEKIQIGMRLMLRSSDPFAMAVKSTIADAINETTVSELQALPLAQEGVNAAVFGWIRNIDCVR